MKLREIQVGEHYAVLLTDKTNYQDADHEGHFLGIPEPRYASLPGVGSAGYSRVRVVAVGVPYRKGNQGVRISYAYAVPRRCPTCGEGLLRDPVTDEVIEDRLTNEITVHASILLGQWDEHELRRAIWRHEWNERLQARRDQLVDEEWRDILTDPGE
jgi:hypothetical protein